MKPVCCLILGVVWWAAQPAWADKTDLAKDHYVEASDTDFVLTVKPVGDAAGKVRSFSVAAPDAGVFTLLCYVDGQFFRRQSIRLPGRYSFNTRGLVPGRHRVTLQVVDAGGRVGSSPQTIVIGP